MASHASEERERRRQQIIDGALAVFSEKGFEKATNQDIAEAAGIGSPGLIYHYFESKTDLLRQVVASRSPMLRHALRSEVLLGMPPRDALRLIGSAFLAALNEPDNLRLFRVIIAEAMRDDAAGDWHRSSSMPVRDTLVGYLSSEIQAGRLRPVNPVAAATCFLGPCLLYALSSEVFGHVDAQRPDAETMVDTTVEIFLRGLEVM